VGPAWDAQRPAALLQAAQAHTQGRRRLGHGEMEHLCGCGCVGVLGVWVGGLVCREHLSGCVGVGVCGELVCRQQEGGGGIWTPGFNSGYRQRVHKNPPPRAAFHPHAQMLSLSLLCE
jgi:hypothetical protein